MSTFILDLAGDKKSQKGLERLIDTALKQSRPAAKEEMKVEKRTIYKRCNTKFIEERTRFRIEDGSVIIRMIHSNN